MTVGLADEQTEQSRLSLSCGTLENDVERAKRFKPLANFWRKICSERFCWILLEKNLVMRCSCVKTSTGWHKLARTLNLGPEVNQNVKETRMVAVTIREREGG